MTTETDKLVEMARALGAQPTHLETMKGALGLRATRLELTAEQLAAFRAAIIADLAADVEPVALVSVHADTPAEFFCAAAFSMLSLGEHDIYPASTVAALKARVAELEKDAEKWRALMTIGRIRPLGAAGCKSLDDQGDYAHIGLELWTTFSGYDNPKLAHIAAHEKESFAAWFEVFMGKAVRLYRAALTKGQQ